MNSKDKKEVADIVAQTVMAILTAKKQDSPRNTGEQNKAQKKQQEKNASPPHKKSDIPALLTAMNRKESIELFGDITKNPPYKQQISPFYNKYNIELDTAKYERKTLTYEQKHSVILTQLKGQGQKLFDKVKKAHTKDLTTKLANPPITNIFGKEMSDKQLESRQASLQKELSRWNNDKYQE